MPVPDGGEGERAGQARLPAPSGGARAGSAGGPLCAPAARVLGVVSASAIDDPPTGYALTHAQVENAAVTGQASSSPVPTGSCE